MRRPPGLACGSGEQAMALPLHVGNEYGDRHVNFASNLAREAYRRFVREFGSVSAFKMAAPPARMCG